MDTANDFKAWRAYMGYTFKQCAIALGKDITTVQRYAGGKAPIPHDTALAMTFLALQKKRRRHLNRWLLKFKKASGLNMRIF